MNCQLRQLYYTNFPRSQRSPSLHSLPELEFAIGQMLPLPKYETSLTTLPPRSIVLTNQTKAIQLSTILTERGQIKNMLHKHFVAVIVFEVFSEVSKVDTRFPNTASLTTVWKLWVRLFHIVVIFSQWQCSTELPKYCSSKHITASTYQHVIKTA